MNSGTITGVFFSGVGTCRVRAKAKIAYDAEPWKETGCYLWPVIGMSFSGEIVAGRGFAGLGEWVGGAGGLQANVSGFLLPGAASRTGSFR